MAWLVLDDKLPLTHLLEASKTEPQIIFKHSTRCTISSMAWNRLQRAKTTLSSIGAFYYLDLIAHRSISNLIAEELQVRHESPQIIVLFRGEVILDQSHNAVDPDEIIAVIQSHQTLPD